MRVLVLGGTHHVGRAVVEAALANGDDVTTVNRGLSRPPAAAVTALVADRTVPGQLATAIGADATWDAVIDTWSLAPRVVHESARLLSGRAGHYGYVSTRSVYGWPIPPGLDENAPVVDADPDSDDGSVYPTAKRGGELAVLDGFDGPPLLARAGLILGPYEDVGRLPWWLGRLAEGGPTLAPGPYDRPLQYIDARDLALWMLSMARRRRGGAYNAVSHPGHATMGTLLDSAVEVSGGRAELVWVDPEVLAAAGIEGWSDLPIWLPPTGDAAGLHDGDVTAAYAAGLDCRPVQDTVADTWDWLQAEGWPPPRTDRPPLGLPRDREDAVLATVTRTTG